MNDFTNIFDADTVETISNLVENKMYVLNKIEDFQKNDEKFALALEELENSISEESRSILHEVMRLNYHIESYYFTLAYFLGKEHSEQSNNL